MFHDNPPSPRVLFHLGAVLQHFGSFFLVWALSGGPETGLDPGWFGFGFEAPVLVEGKSKINHPVLGMCPNWGDTP